MQAVLVLVKSTHAYYETVHKLTDLVIYGFILVFILQCFLGASLAEFVSAYPVEGGMYHWIAAISPKRFNSILSFATGWSTVFGCTWTKSALLQFHTETDSVRDFYYGLHKPHLCLYLNGSCRVIPDRHSAQAVDDLCGFSGP